ncbi:MAG: hypothetical protein HC925_06370 [Coleofasciculaceae cyanobacterium SM2_3_26]|nr:hypothetical protein [Coleofasciculaceae cyanobacterium SM2_3_26]
MQTSHLEAENQYNYNRLMVALETSQGKLDLLIAVCNDRNLQADIIARYEAELQQQDTLPLRVFVSWQDPSLRLTLERLVEQTPELQAGRSAVVTVQGVETLIAVRLGEPESQQERFFGYFAVDAGSLSPISFSSGAMWVTEQVLTQLAERSPDFWSWRGGVFWFGVRAEDIPHLEQTAVAQLPILFHSQEAHVLFHSQEAHDSLQALLQRIAVLEEQPDPDPLELADLFERLGEVYAKRFQTGEHRQFAIQALKRAIQLQTQLGRREKLAKSWEQLGDLYFELKDDVNQAAEAYNRALDLYSELSKADPTSETLRLGEANTLKAIGDVLQFLDQRREALSRYDEALGIYRQVGARLGAANVLCELGRLQDEPNGAMAYFLEAQDIYERIGDKYSQGRNLLMFIWQAQAQLGDIDGVMCSLDAAAAIGDEIGFEPFRQRAEEMRAELLRDRPDVET